MAIPRKPEWSDMQGLVVSAYPHLHAAEYVPLKIDDEGVGRTRTWLTTIANHVTSAVRRVGDASVGLRAAPELNLNIAFSRTGLDKLLGIKTEEVGKFVPAFVDGISGDPHRSQILGDIGDSHPSKWAWGAGPDKDAVDLLLMVFAPDEKALANAVQVALDGSGTQRVSQPPPPALRLDPADRREHFGFVDGISQPILEGTADAERYPESSHVTALGEFVFGYPDGTSAIACGPSLPDWAEFGVNGTYLVFRQLEQRVADFWNCMYQSKRASHLDDDTAADDLASKIVGRRPDGTPLVPEKRSGDNEFDFGDDKDGYSCPMGAHIRRANPRRALAGAPLTRALTNRHRLLRRGRPYGPRVPPPDRRKDDGQERGLLFLALNSDFERQFEFIHQNWMNGSGFSGLDGERDPLVGWDVPRRFTVAGPPARVRVGGLGRFVTVKGGEYFFLPGIKALRYLGNPRP